METIGGLMQYGPHSIENFNTIYANRNNVPDKKETVACWLYGISLEYPLYVTEPMTSDIEQCKQIAIKIIKNIERQNPTADIPSALDLDCIWMLWFSTKDKRYPDMIRKIALRIPISHNGIKGLDPVKSAAKWSYESVMKVSISQS